MATQQVPTSSGAENFGNANGNGTASSGTNLGTDNANTTNNTNNNNANDGNAPGPVSEWNEIFYFEDDAAFMRPGQAVNGSYQDFQLYPNPGPQQTWSVMGWLPLRSATNHDNSLNFAMFEDADRDDNWPEEAWPAHERWWECHDEMKNMFEPSDGTPMSAWLSQPMADGPPTFLQSVFVEDPGPPPPSSSIDPSGDGAASAPVERDRTRLRQKPGRGSGRV